MKIEYRRAGEILAAALLLGSRVWCFPLSFLWQDALTVLSLYWIFVALGKLSAHRAAVTLGVCSYLLGIYLFGQVPNALQVWGWTP